MKVNDSSLQSHHLLNWINQERYTQGSVYPLITYQEIKQTNTLEQLLNDIDSTIFNDISIEKQRYIEKIQMYLDKQYGKRMRIPYKNSLTSLSQLIKLICYFCTKCQDKNKYINRIFSLPADTQQFFMEQLQKIQGQLQNIIEIKEVLGRVEYIQEQNERLRQNLQKLTDTHMKLLGLYQQLQQEQNTTKLNLDKMQKQKQQTMSTLGIISIKEYIEIYNQSKQQNHQLIQLIQKSQQKNKFIQDNMISLNKKISGDSMVINQLNDEVTRYKQLYFNLKQQNSINSVLTGNILTQSSSNKKGLMWRSGNSFNKQNMKNSYMKSIQTNNNSYSLLSEQDDDQKLRKYNNQLMIKLEDMYTKYNNLNDQHNNFRLKNEELEKQNNFRQKKQRYIGKAQNLFMKKYVKTMRTFSMKK